MLGQKIADYSKEEICIFYSSLTTASKFSFELRKLIGVDCARGIYQLHPRSRAPQSEVFEVIQNNIKEKTKIIILLVDDGLAWSSFLDDLSDKCGIRRDKDLLHSNSRSGVVHEIDIKKNKIVQLDF